MRKVTQAPSGASVVTLMPNQEVVLSSSPGALPVRLTDDPGAPAYRNIDYDATHPYRRKELVAAVLKRLPEAATLAPYDIQCVKQVYALDGDERFCHHPKYATPQYSEAFADWLVEQYANDASFFEEARRRVKEASRSEGGRPSSEAVGHCAPVQQDFACAAPRRGRTPVGDAHSSSSRK